MTERTAKGQFVKGTSGNPAGVPLDGELRLRSQIVTLRENMELAIRQGPLSVNRVCKVINKMLDLAEKGDTKAAKLILALAVGAGSDDKGAPKTPARVSIVIENATFGQPALEAAPQKLQARITNSLDAEFEVVKSE